MPVRGYYCWNIGFKSGLRDAGVDAISSNSSFSSARSYAAVLGGAGGVTVCLAAHSCSIT